MIHLKQNKNCPTIEPRDAFYGGRTNAAKLYHEISDNEKIYYMDFCSLYPYVLKNSRFPIGHPKRLYDFKTNDISIYDGLIFCSVNPPRDLYFPILPLRINNKLVFTLCHSCAKNNSNVCQHNIEERKLIGVWTTPELKKALEFGYEIIRIFEIWHFEEFSEINENSNGLFGDFINTCIKGKIEASGWPRENISEKEKDEYIKNYESNEGIILDKNNIEINPGKRHTFKLVVNSFWGKWGQNPMKMHKTEYIRQPEIFFNMLSDDTLEIDDAYLISENVIQVRYSKKCEFRDETNNSNVVIAAFVTAYARLKLFELINKLGKRCLYFDTDSAIFYAKPDDYIPKTGLYLGELTDEVKTVNEPDAYITKFLSCGPKNYCYEIFNPNQNKFEYVIKIKGLSLNFETNKLINFDSMKNIIDLHIQSQDTCINIPQFKFVTNNFNEVETKNFLKSFQLVFDKRVLNSDYTTLPFGFQY
jgi:hypothetical protein